jgi:hypothetical protein
MALIKKLWQIAWDIWGHKNGRAYEKLNPKSAKDNETLNLQLRDAYYILQDSNLQQNRHLLGLPLRDLLKKSEEYRRLDKTRSKAAGQALKEEYWRKRAAQTRSTEQMKANLRRWLSTYNN